MKRALILVPCLLLAACGDKPSGPAERGGKAAGEVLGGEISDAMIPLDEVSSQAPLAPRQGPSAEDLDAEQPEVTPAEGVEGEGEAASAEVAATPAAVTPDE